VPGAPADSQPAPAQLASATSAPEAPAGGTKPGVAMTECPLCRRSVPMATADRHVDSCMRQHSVVEAAASRKRSAPTQGGHASSLTPEQGCGCALRYRIRLQIQVRSGSEFRCSLCCYASVTPILEIDDVVCCRAQRLRRSGSASSHRRMRLGAASHLPARRQQRRAAKGFRRVFRSMAAASRRMPAARRRRRHPRRRVEC